jgi:hypothetical protein
MNRFITSLIQIGLGVPTFFLARAMYHDIKENGLFPEE